MFCSIKNVGEKYYLMKEFILNEKKYIEEILETHDNSKESLFQMIHYLSRYYYSTLEKRDIVKNVHKRDGSDEQAIDYKVLNEQIDILEKLVHEELLKFNYDDYALYKWREEIRKACSLTIKYNLTLKEFESIPLLSDELEKIQQCDTDREKKLLFTLYIFARYKGRNGRIDTEYVKKTIFDLANINDTTLEKHKIVASLRDKGFIFQNFINDDINIWVPMGTGEPVMEVLPIGELGKLDKLGNQLIAYLKSQIDEKYNYKICARCGCIIKVKSNSQKFCDKCSPIVTALNKRRFYLENSKN